MTNEEYKKYVPQQELIQELEQIITNLKNNHYCLDGEIRKNYEWDNYNTKITRVNYNIKLSIIPTPSKEL